MPIETYINEQKIITDPNKTRNFKFGRDVIETKGFPKGGQIIINGQPQHNQTFELNTSQINVKFCRTNLNS